MRLKTAVGMTTMAGLATRVAAKSTATAGVRTLAVAGLLCLGAASPALSAGYTLTITPPPSLTVGKPGVFQASGSNPPDDFFASWLDVAAIPTSVVPSCPADYLNANQIARSSHAQGGDVIVTAQRENVDAAGSFSLSFAFTPTQPGRFLVCAYSNDGATWTHTMASATVDVQAAPTGRTTTGPSQSPGIAKPVNVKKPTIARSALRLACRRGSWSNRPSRYSYTWLVNGRPRRGASGHKLAITRKLRGRKVQCRVRAANAGGTGTAVSRPLRIPRSSAPGRQGSARTRR